MGFVSSLSSFSKSVPQSVRAAGKVSYHGDEQGGGRYLLTYN